jgi:RecA-family ATPase
MNAAQPATNFTPAPEAVAGLAAAPGAVGSASSSPPVALLATELARRVEAQRAPVGARLDADAAVATGAKILNAAHWLKQTMEAVRQILPGLLDAGAKMLVNGSSKARKTFLVVQLALCLASGRRFLRWTPPRAFRVLLLQGEVTATHFHARLLRALAALAILIEDLGDRLRVVNSRGHAFTLDAPPEWLLRAAADVDVVIVDPVYKFFDGEENSGTDVARFLRGLDALTEKSGAAVVYVHHSAKLKFQAR